VAVVSAAGRLVASAGDADAFIYLRSSAKPFQLAPFVASGRFDAYDFPAPVEALAIMAASHAGEDRHARTVQALLRAGGLTREVLACGTHPPFDRETAERLLRDGEPPSPLRHNCSGKHAGMACTPRLRGGRWRPTGRPIIPSSMRRSRRWPRSRTCPWSASPAPPTAAGW
jgi:L-asparaginase II